MSLNTMQFLPPHIIFSQADIFLMWEHNVLSNSLIFVSDIKTWLPSVASSKCSIMWLCRTLGLHICIIFCNRTGTPVVRSLTMDPFRSCLMTRLSLNALCWTKLLFSIQYSNAEINLSVYLDRCSSSVSIIRYGASLGGAKSNVFNPTLRLFSHTCLISLILVYIRRVTTTRRDGTKSTNNRQTPSPWWWSRSPLQRRGFDEPMPPEGWAALRMLVPMPPSKRFNRSNKLM